MRLHQIGLLFVALTSNYLLAAELQRIQLQDGSTVHAEALSLNGGVYTLRSPAPNPAAASETEFERIQSALLSNGDTVNIIMSLMNDPAVQAILADGDIMAAIQRSDFNALSSNPKIRKLMNKAEIKQITGSVIR